MTDLNVDALLFTGFLAGGLLIPALWALARLLFVEVQEGEAALVVRFGRLSATLSEPGWHWMPDRAMPWVALKRVSQRRDFRQISGIVVNDARGTTVIVDLWLEVRVVDPARATFAVDDWDRALSRLVSHAAQSILAGRSFDQILADRTEFLSHLTAEIADETRRWGIDVGSFYLQRVSLLPDVTERLFRTISARLERYKADIEESGHQKIAMLEADTTKQIAQLVGQAKGQYPAAVGRALGAMKESRDVFHAFQQLYELSQLRPHRTLAFKGFKDGEVRSFDAALFAAQGPPEIPSHKNGGP